MLRYAKVVACIIIGKNACLTMLEREKMIEPKQCENGCGRYLHYCSDRCEKEAVDRLLNKDFPEREDD